MGLRPAAVAFIAVLVTAAWALGLVLLSRTAPLDPGEGLLAVALGAAVALTWLFPLHFAFKDKLCVDTAAVFAAVLLCPPAVAMLVAGLGTLVAHGLRRESRDPVQAAFNGAQQALGAALGGLLLVGAGWDHAGAPSLGPRSLAALAAAAAAMYLANTAAVATIAGLQTGISPWRLWRRAVIDGGPVDALTHGALVGLGVAAALLADDHPGGLLLLAPPVIGTYATLRHHVGLRLRAEEALRGSEAGLAEAQRIAHLGSWDWDLATDRHLWSAETYRILGFAPETFPATAEIFLGCVHPEDRTLVDTAVHDALRLGRVLSLDHRVLLPDGTERVIHAQGESIRDAADRPVRMVGTLHDVTERKALEARLVHQAFHDPLTGLPNRALLVDRLEAALAGRGRARPGLAVLFLDLDGFKLVNDGLGHDAGDRLLVQAAERLRTAVRSGDTAARFGGDEFVVLLEDLPAPADAVAFAERIVRSLRRPYQIDGQEAVVSVSIGVAHGEIGRTRAIALLRDVDAALYQAKAAGKNRVVVFEPKMNADAAHRLALRVDLERAVERGEFRLYYQPMVDLTDGRLVGVEALVRWQHPVHGLVPPDGFVPVAEETGLILPLGGWVLDEACRQAATWTRLYPSVAPFRIGVNLSLRQLREPNLVAQVVAALRASELEPGRLEIEVTERVLVEDLSTVAGTLRGLRAFGVRLALDDVGTGHSSLAHLRALEVDVLKVDRSFVGVLAHDRRSLAITEALVALAGTLGMPVTAEGIETVDELVRARAIGCRLGQGFHFARPMPADEVGDLIGRSVTFDVARNVVPGRSTGVPGRRLAATAGRG